MEKEFVKYEQALDLKELGFDKSCLAIYSNANTKTGLYNLKKYKLKLIRQDSQVDKGVSVPTYQSAFRWFREKYNLQHELYSSQKSIWLITIRDTSSTNEHCIYKGKIWDCDDLDENIPDTYEEAESACLDRLIEIVKNK